jgi:cholest-4-en-3-one 26-monooxygenase
MDPPEHRWYRRLVADRFTPRAVGALEGVMSAVAEQHVQAFAARLLERADRTDRRTVLNLDELMERLPLELICHMAGIGEEHWPQISENNLVLTRGRAGDPAYRRHGETAEDAMMRTRVAWRAFTEAQVMDRQARGAEGDDLLSKLLRADLNGRLLAPHEVAEYFRLLVAAGTGTTREALLSGIKGLLEHPDQVERLVADPSLVPTAVEEMLRWGSIITSFQRTCLEDVELGGEVIRRGESVVMFYPSANRDEKVFHDSYTFDVGRDPNPHFAFGGYGEHVCLGINLARWEMRAMLQAMLPLLPRLELAGKAERVGGAFLHSVPHKTVPVCLKPA